MPGHYQQWIGLGTVYKGPWIDELADGTRTARFVLQTIEGKNKKGIQIANYHEVMAFGRNASIVGSYVKNWDHVGVVGKVLGQFDRRPGRETELSRIDLKFILLGKNDGHGYREADDK